MTRYARALAFANLGDIATAKFEADVFDYLLAKLCTNNRILHNNTVTALLAVDSPMIHDMSSSPLVVFVILCGH
eukprot:scaffold90093_cov25-Attheya_sp.AAC.1